MSDDFPTTSELVRAAAEGTASGAIGALIEPVRSFLATLLGPATTELGGWAGDLVAFRRWQSRVKMLRRAEEILGAAGLTAHEVPLRLLVPIIEVGGDEDRPDMQGRWDYLLANAATTDNALAAYPWLLSQLEPVEARALDYMIGPPGGPGWSGPADALKVRVDGLASANIDNLQRLELVRLNLMIPPVGARNPNQDMLSHTALAVGFVAACRPPA